MAWLSEIDKAASAVLSYRFPDIPNLGDMTKIADQIDIGLVEAPDGLVGGTPCQGFSVAGRRGGLTDPRGQLTLSFVEIADAIDRARRAAGQPECVILWENVPGVLSMRDNAFGNFLAALAGEDVPLEPTGKRWSDAGVVLGPERAIAWRTLDAQFFGLAQRRKRVFVVASARDGFDPGEVLLEWEGLRRDSPPSRKAGEGITHDVAPCLTGSGRGIERSGDTRGQDPVVAVDDGHRLTNRVSREAFGGGNCSGPIAAAAALNANERYDFDSETFVVEPQCVTGDITHTLKAEGFDASEDGTGRGQPIVPTAYRTSGNCGAWETGDRVDALTTGTDPFSHILTFQGRGSNVMVDDDLSGTLTENCDRASGGAPCVAFTAKDYGADATDDLSPTLRAGGHSDSHANGGVMPAVAYSVALRGREGGATAELGDEVATCLRTGGGGGGGGDKPHVLFNITPSNSNKDYNARRGAYAQTVTTQSGSSPSARGGDVIVEPQMAVRRLMPVECERLQGFPDGWTRIPVRRYPTQQTSETRPPDMWEPDPNGGWWLMAADGPRYKQLGNSMAVRCMGWIGSRIAQQLRTAEVRNLIG
jgi:DNA (cytosine-5)-methyltransferase 1